MFAEDSKRMIEAFDHFIAKLYVFRSIADIGKVQ